MKGFTDHKKQIAATRLIKISRTVASRIANESDNGSASDELDKLTHAIEHLESSFAISLLAHQLSECQLKQQTEVVVNHLKKLSDWLQKDPNVTSIPALHSSEDIPYDDPTCVKKPSRLNYSFGYKPGHVEIIWTPIENAVHYFVEISENPDNPLGWKFLGWTRKPSLLVSSLRPSVTYWVRVMAVSEIARSKWSHPLKIRSR